MVEVHIQWRRANDLPEFDRQPIRQFIIVEGLRTHHGDTWARRHWGIAMIERDGPFGYRQSDIDQIVADGDMDPWTARVTHWAPAIVMMPHHA